MSDSHIRTQRRSAVHNPAGASHVARLRAAEKHDYVCDFIHLGNPAHWDCVLHDGLQRWVRGDCLGNHWSVDPGGA